jgi:peptide/nickel transport system substrate-binding protein
MAALVVAVSGCGGGSGKGGVADAQKVTTTVAAATGDVDRLVWGLPYGEPRTIDPILGLDYSPSLVTSQLCDTLLRAQPDGSLKPGLASFTQPDDKTLVYKLRSGATFWDGTPVTTKDVVYSLKRAAAPDSYVALIFANVKAIKATGADAVTITFKKPDALFNKEMASFSASVLQRAFAEKAGKKLGSPSGGIMCSGPFKLDSWKSGSSIELSRNDAYWDPEYKAHAKRLTFKFFNDSTALAQALVAGEVDGAYEVPPSAIPRLSSTSSGKLSIGPSRQYVTIERRRSTGPIASTKLREALFRTIDREGIAKVVFAGAAKANYTLLTPESWDPQAKDAWAAAYAPFEKAGRMDTAAAKQLVAESGYKGETVEIGILAGDTTQSQLAQIMQQSAQQIGVKMAIKSLQPTAYSDALVNGKADAGDLVVTVSFNIVADPLEQIPYYVLPDSPYNYAGYDDKAVIDNYTKALSTLDPATRAPLLIAAQKRYEAAFEFTSVVAKNEVSFLSKRLAGAPTSLDYLFVPSLAKVGAAG